MIVVTVARRPLAGSVASSVLEDGTGAMNIDATRIATTPGDETTSHVQGVGAANTRHTLHNSWQGIAESYQTSGQKLGRWPANLILEHQEWCMQEGCGPDCSAGDLDAQGEGVGVHGAGAKKVAGGSPDTAGGWGFIGQGDYGGARYGDKGGASRFFKQVGVVR